MANEPIYETIKADSRTLLGETQTVVEARLLPPAGTIIARVLAITADSSSEPSEAFTGEVRFAGKVEFKVLFVGDEGKSHETEHSAEFSDKLESELITSAHSPSVESTVIDVDVTTVSGGEIRLAAVVETKAWANDERELRYLAEADEYVERATADYCKLTAEGKTTAEYSATLENVKITDVMLCEHKAFVTERTANIGSIRVSGVIISEVCGETEDGLLASYRVETPFSEEWGADGAEIGDLVTARVCVDGKTALEGDGDERALVFNYDLKFDYAAYKTEIATLVCDLFSPTYEMKKTAVENKISLAAACATLTDRVEGNVALEADMPLADNILAATGTRLAVTNLVAADGEALVEGVVTGNVVYYAAEDDVISSVLVELPFSTTKKLDGVTAGDSLFGRGTVTAVSLKLRRGNEIEVKADVAIEVEAFRPSVIATITQVERGEEIVAPTAAISIHVAKKGETAWETAKALGATPEAIARQNPDLHQPFEGGERVVFYRYLGEDR